MEAVYAGISLVKGVSFLGGCSVLNFGVNCCCFFKARGLIAWTDVVILDMKSDQPIHDLQGADWLQKEHLQLQVCKNSFEQNALNCFKKSEYCFEFS